MSNNSLAELVFERYSSDDLELQEIYNLCVTSPIQHLSQLRSRALAIQDRWAGIEALSVAGNSRSRVLGVETLAADIDSYLRRQFRAVGGYVAKQRSHIQVLRTVFPNASDDMELASIGAASLDPALSSAGTALAKFIADVNSVFAGADPRNDTRDVLRYVRSLDERFQRVASELHPDTNLISSRAYQLNLLKPVDAVAETVSFGAGSAAAAPVIPANSWIALAQGDYIRRLLVHTNAVVANKVNLLTVAPGAKVITLRVTCDADYALQFDGPGWQSTQFARAVNPAGMFVNTVTLTTTPGGGLITMGVTNVAALASITMSVTLISVERLDGAPLAFADPNDTVISCVNSGRIDYFQSAFAFEPVAELLGALSRRDTIASSRNQPTLKTRLVNIWKSKVPGSGPAVNAVIAAYDNVPVASPYTYTFWCADPFNVTQLLTTAGFSWTHAWVQEASAIMYRAFYEYLVAAVNAGSLDPLLLEACQ